MVAVVAVVLGARRRHGPERHPPPLLLLPLEVAVVELEVVVLDGLGEGELLRVPDFCEEKKGVPSVSHCHSIRVSNRNKRFNCNLDRIICCNTARSFGVNACNNRGKLPVQMGKHFEAPNKTRA